MTSTGEPTPHAVRAVTDIDVAGVADALDNASGDIRWWYEPATGRVEPDVTDNHLDDLADEGDRDHEMLLVESLGSRDSYRDMVDFANAVGDPRAAQLLTRALEGRGAFRRFRDTIDAFDELRPQWLAYRRAASERRAITWLDERHLVERSDVETELELRSATMSRTLAAIASDRDQVFDAADVAHRLDEIAAALDAGTTITVTRDGQRWATITPFYHRAR